MYTSLTDAQRERQYHSMFDSLSQIRVTNKDFTFQVIHEKTLCEKRKFLKAFYYKVCDEKMIA